MIWKFFGEGADALLKSKITAANLPRVAQPQAITEIPKQHGKYMMKNPFKQGSELSKFGKQQIRGDFYIIESTSAKIALHERHFAEVPSLFSSILMMLLF